MPTLNTRSWRGQLGGADLGEDDRGARIVVERARRRARRSACASWSSLHLRDDHVRPRRRSPLSARSSASWSRPSTRAALQPSSSKRAAIAARPVVGRGAVVDDDRGEAPEPEPAGELHRLPVAALVELGVAHEADHARALAAPRASSAEGHADRDRQAVAERAARDLHAGDEHAIGVVAQRRVEGAEAGQARRRRRSPWPRARRSTPPGRGPWRAGSDRGRDRRCARGSTRRTRS